MNEMMKPTILIVDDSKTTRAMIKRVIRMMDLQVENLLEAENGAEALNVLAGAVVDLVLADLNMPVMDGFQLVERMRGDARYRRIPVAVISAQPDQEKIEFLKHHGVAAYLSKPFTPEAIRNVVMPLLAEQKPAEAPAAEKAPDLLCLNPPNNSRP
jgi:two-component system chemotaxis response regulator CheY